MQRSRVLLPDPLEPRMTTVSPLWTSRSTPLRTSIRLTSRRCPRSRCSRLGVLVTTNVLWTSRALTITSSDMDPRSLLQGTHDAGQRKADQQVQQCGRRVDLRRLERLRVDDVRRLQD